MSTQMRISLIYLSMSALWILLSDAIIIGIFGSNPQLIYTIQTVKGWLFVTFTAAMLYWLIQREMQSRQQIEDNLRKSEHHFRSLFMNNPQAVWVIHPETLAFIDVNTTAMVRYGYARDEFLQMKLLDLHMPEDRDRLQVSNIEDTRTGASSALSFFSGVWRHQLKNGKIIYVELRAHTIGYRGKSRELPDVMIIARDITERREAQAELLHTRRMLEHIIRASPLAIFTRDWDGIVNLWNPAAEQLFGRSAAEVKGKSFFLVAESDTYRYTTFKDAVQSGKTVTGIEVHHTRLDGTSVDLLVSMAPICGDEERPDVISEIVVIVMDVTERKQFEEDKQEKQQLRLALDRELQLRNLRNQVLSIMSHEFRNPLTTILNSAEMVNRYYDRMTPEDRTRHWRQVQVKVQETLDLLNDSLTLLKAEAVTPDFRPDSLDLIALTESLVDEARLNAGQKYDLRLDKSVSSLAIQADQKLLRHALQNLLANAVKYSPDGGIIDMKIEPTDEAVLISVRDQGIGIPPDNLECLFQAFYRGGNVGKIPGTGLGLTIVKQATELHGGEVRVESQVGAGTTFTLSLPIKLPQPM
ncbi:MAG TPA: ATP-binding protein [Phototrophicaceae bacterium]|nr:ATP-binding protein [Phototrophicaceae bacterium]